VVIDRLQARHPAPRRARELTLPRLALFAACVLLGAVVAGFSGCGDHDEPRGLTKQAVEFDSVPENIRTAAQKAIPAVKLNEAWKNLDPKGELHSYEIRGKNPANGKIREVRVSLTGEILELE
jgi:hypothetical protein